MPLKLAITRHPPISKCGDVVVVLDNFPEHKVSNIRAPVAIRRAQLFYLPPYSTE